MAGYVFIALRLPTIVLASSHTWLMKLFTSIMIYMQLLQVFVLALGPGIFASILFGTTQFIATHFLEPDLEELQDHRIESMIRRPQIQLATVVTTVYLLCYLIFLRVHRYPGGTPYAGWAWAMVTVLNLLTTFLFIFSIGLTQHALADVGHNAWEELKRTFSDENQNESPLDMGSVRVTARCVPVGMQWDTAIATCGTANELSSCEREVDCTGGGSCLAAVCSGLSPMSTPYVHN
jgi:hypothetical protein